MFSHLLISDRLSISQHPKLSSQNAVELFCELWSHIPGSGMSPPGRASVTVPGAPLEAGSVGRTADWLCRSKMPPGDTPAKQARGGLGWLVQESAVLPSRVSGCLRCRQEHTSCGEMIFLVGKCDLRPSAVSSWQVPWSPEQTDLPWTRRNTELRACSVSVRPLWLSGHLTSSMCFRGPRRRAFRAL